MTLRITKVDEAYYEGYRNGYKDANNLQLDKFLLRLVGAVNTGTANGTVYVVINENSEMFRTSSIWTDEEAAIEEMNRFKEEEGDSAKVYYSEFKLNDSIF